MNPETSAELLEKAVRYRHMARIINDAKAADALETLAREYERQVGHTDPPIGPERDRDDGRGGSKRAS